MRCCCFCAQPTFVSDVTRSRRPSTNELHTWNASAPILNVCHFTLILLQIRKVTLLLLYLFTIIKKPNTLKWRKLIYSCILTSKIMATRVVGSIIKFLTSRWQRRISRTKKMKFKKEKENLGFIFANRLSQFAENGRSRFQKSVRLFFFVLRQN